jgi:hypothetical protein
MHPSDDPPVPEPLDFEGKTSATGNRRAAIVALVVIVFIAVALAKPWDLVTAPANPSPAAVVPSAVAPSAGASAASPGASSRASSSDASTFQLGAPADAVWASVQWQQLDPGQALGQVQRVVRWPGGFLALGSDHAGGTPLWSSADGQAWDPVPYGTADGFWPGLRVLAATPMNDTLWAEATVPMSTSTKQAPNPAPTTVMPWSSGDGHAWQPVANSRLPIPLGLDGPVLLASSPTRLVLAWNELTLEGSSRAQVWWSADGADWHQVPLTSLPVGFEVFGLAPSPGGAFLAAGRSTRAGTVSAELLRSESGDTWTPLTLPTDQLADSQTKINVVSAVFPAGQGMLAVGSVDELPGQELWWASFDGARWASIPAFWPLGLRPCPTDSGVSTAGTGGCGAFPNGVIASDGQRIVALRADGAGGGWTSSDGRDWQQFGTGPGPHPTSIDGLVVLPSGLLASADGAVWFGQADAGQ